MLTTTRNLYTSMKRKAVSLICIYKVYRFTQKIIKKNTTLNGFFGFSLKEDFRLELVWLGIGGS